MTANRRDALRSARPGSAGLALAGAGLAGLLAASAAAGDGGTQVVSVDVGLAPSQIDGTCNLMIAVGDDATPDVMGVLQAQTDGRGRVRGTLVVDTRTFTVTGSVSHTPKRSRGTLVAKAGKDRLTLRGDFRVGDFAGTATGRGSVAPGKHPFGLALGSGAMAGDARVEFTLTEDARGRLSGAGHVATCGDDLTLRVSGRTTKNAYTVSLSAGRSFRLTGRGAPSDGTVDVNWTASGYGARGMRGAGLPLETLPPPAALVYAGVPAEIETEDALVPIVPQSGSAPRGAFTVEPALPAGLALDAATGTVYGNPSEIRGDTTYTVTASNYAGTSQAAFTFRTRINRARSFAPETRTLTDDDLRHFLLRTQFGVRPADLDRLRSLGIDPFIDGMLIFDQNGPAEAVAAPELLNGSDPPGLEGKFPSSTQLARWWSSLMMNTTNPFQERMAFFWHDLFAASTEVLGGGDTYMMRDYVDLFRFRGNGNLRDLLVRMSRDPCMLTYLDGFRNTASAPNENFAREFWELFTLGVDNGYTQDDIVQAAKAFTGYRRTVSSDTGLASMSFDYRNHDHGSKSFFGQTIPGQASGAGETDDFQRVVDITLDHRPAAEYVVRKVFEHFAYDAPPQSLVDDMAASLRASNYELTPFLRALFRSEAFFSKTARRSLVKNPVEFTMGFIHTTGLEIPVSTLTSSLITLGQAPTQPPTVNGWPLGDQWFSAQNMADRMNAVYTVIEDTTRQNNNGMNVSAVLPPAGQRTSGEVVDWVADLMRVTLTAEERLQLVTYLDTSVTGTASAPVATPSPFNASSQTHLDQRLRGVLYVLAQHPSYQVR